MKIKILYILAAVILITGGSVYATTCCAQAEETKGVAGSKAVSVGNTVCPVTGEPVDNKTTYEYKGKIYNFCCPKCIDAFKINPEKYSAKAEQSSGVEYSMHEGHQHSH